MGERINVKGMIELIEETLYSVRGFKRSGLTEQRLEEILKRWHSLRKQGVREVQDYGDQDLERLLSVLSEERWKLRSQEEE